MAVVDLQQIMKSIDKGQFQSLYLLIGEERYFSERILSQLRQKVVSGDLREFNEDVYYGSELDIDKLIDSLQTLPIMADRRLVILKEAHLLTEKIWTQLDEQYDSSNLSTVFVVQGDQVDKRKKIIKKWFDVGVVAECLTPQEAARAPWIRSLAQEKGLELENDALGYLVQMGGNTLEEIDKDLDKLFLFFGEPRRVSIGDVAQILQRTRDESIFALSEAVGKRDRPQALFLFHRLLEQGENELALVALLARHIRLLLKTKTAFQAGVKGPALAQKVGVNNYFIGNYLQQSNLWSTEDLNTCLINLAQLDRQLKSSSLPADLWMERFLFFPNSSIPT